MKLDCCPKCNGTQGFTRIVRYEVNEVRNWVREEGYQDREEDEFDNYWRSKCVVCLDCNEKFRFSEVTK